MATLVLTAIGDDQAGLVEALAGVIVDHGGNWERSHMTQLVGKFAGIVMITVPDGNADALIADLEPLEAKGLLDITVEQAASAESATSSRLLSLELVGVDHPGIVRDISHALAAQNVSIEDLRSEISSAPMAGGRLFEAAAIIRVPGDIAVEEVRSSLEDLAAQLMVDIAITDEAIG